MRNVRADINLRPYMKYNNHWPDFHYIFVHQMFVEFVQRNTRKSNDLISDTSRNGGQVKSPSKTSHTYFPHITKSKDKHTIPLCVTIKYVHPKLRIYFLITLRDQQVTRKARPKNPSRRSAPPAPGSMHVLHHSCGSPRLAALFSFKSSFIYGGDGYFYSRLHSD
jgi:hypothetical protein